jgi:ribosomal protein L37AE/L43A
MRKFQRKIENFTCENCGKKVKGTGYTNHCPNCLFSRHVDINPGDRGEICGGLMEPVGLEMNKNEYIILHRCKKCGAERKNHADKNDSVEALINLSETLAKRTMF